MQHFQSKWSEVHAERVVHDLLQAHNFALDCFAKDSTLPPH
jgi:hypothetical protein